MSSSQRATMTDPLRVTSERTGTTVRITVAGEIDSATADILREHTVSHLVADPAEFVVPDLTAVSFIDSSGLRVIIEAAEKDNGRLRIIPSPSCLRLFEITGVGDRLRLIDGGIARSTPPD